MQFIAANFHEAGKNPFFFENISKRIISRRKLTSSEESDAYGLKTD
jgi:hypothetical protein